MLSPIGSGIFSKLNDMAIEMETLDVFLPSHPEYDYISYWNKVKDNFDWQMLLEIPYALEDIEKGAFDKQKSFIESVKRYYEQKFDYCKAKDDFLNFDFDASKNIEFLNGAYDFNLDKDSVEQFKKLNQIVSCDIRKNPFGEYYYNNSSLTSPNFFKSAMWFGVKYLLQVYKTKTTMPIPDNLVEHFKNKKIDAINEDISWLK